MTNAVVVANHAAIVDEVVFTVKKISAEQILRLASEASDDAAYDAAYDDELAAEAALGGRAEKMVMPAIDEADRLAAVRGYAQEVALNDAWDAALDAALDADRFAAAGAALSAAWGAARDTVLATLTCDLITPDQYDTLTQSWTTTIGEI